MASDDPHACAEQNGENYDGRVQVFLRLLPVPDNTKDDVNDEDGSIEVENKTVSIFTADQDEPTVAEFDGLWRPPDTETYTHMADDVATQWVNGRDATIVAYGPRQTGKTRALFGKLADLQRSATEKTHPTYSRSAGTAKSETPAAPSAEPLLKSSENQTNGDRREEVEKTESGESASEQYDQDENDAPTEGVKSNKNVDKHSDKQSSSDSPESSIQDENQVEPGVEAEEEGIASSLLHRMFELLEQDASEILSLTIKVSVVEIYLDRMIDLLLPGTTIHCQNNARGGATVFSGCAALSCVTPTDVEVVIRRALQQRTASQHEPFRDSHRSTVAVQIKLEQERMRDVHRKSVLQIFDLCASEIDDEKNGSTIDKQIAAGILALQQEVQNPSPFSAITERPTLTQLLLPMIRGETVGRVVLTACERQVQACVRTMEFGRACKALPPVRLPIVRDENNNNHSEGDEETAEVREKRLTELVFALASECQKIARTAKTPKHGPVWTAIHEIQKLPYQHRPLRFFVETRREHEINAEKFAIRAELREAERKAATHKHLMKQLESDIAVLRAQNEQLKQELKHRSEQYDRIKHQGMNNEKRVKEIEHHLRTSQFRESEAVVFLRQFRKFYYRLLRQIHGEDKSPGGSIVKHIAGAPDLVQLIDLDKSMVESGLMEESEIGKDISLSKVYVPSQQALVRSNAAAERVANATGEVIDGSVDGSTPVKGKEAVILTDTIQSSSIVSRHETGEATEARQRIYKTPAGQYLEMREKALEEELLAVAEKLAQVQNELQEERETRMDLENTSGTVNKAKHAKELRLLKDQLTRKSNDLKAVIFKMNEIHTVSKALQEKVADREQHVQYLEEELSKMQTKESTLLLQHEQAEATLKEELSVMKKQIKETHIPVWQFSEPGAVPPPISSRISLSFAMKSSPVSDSELDLEHEVSQGEEDDWLDKLYTDTNYGLGLRGGDGGNNETEEVETLRNEVQRLKEQLKEADTRPVKRWTKPSTPPRASNLPKAVPSPAPAPAPTPPAARKQAEMEASTSSVGVDDEQDDLDYGYGQDSDHGSVKSASGMGDIDGFLFMDDEGTSSPVKRRGSVYSGIVDAYNMQSHLPPALGEDSEEKEEVQPCAPPHASPNKPDVVDPPQQKRKPPVQSHVPKWTPPTVKMDDDDNDSTTPEWMKKFRTIAARNMGESVIETSGAAEARELTRTQFGETLKLSHNADARDTSTDDGPQAHESGGSISSAAAEENSESSREVVDVAETAAPLSSGSAYSESRDFSSATSSPDKTGAIDEEESFDTNRLKNMFSQKAANAKPLVPGGSQFNSYSSTTKKWTPRKKKDDDSDSDDSFAKGFLSGAGHVVEPHEAPEPEPDTESEEEPEPEPEPTPDTRGMGTEAKSFLDRDEDSDDSEEEISKMASVMPASLSPKSKSPKAVSHKKKSFLDDSETGADSDEDVPKQAVLPNTPELNKSAPTSATKKSFLDDSDSDEDSDDEGKASAVPKPSPPPVQQKTPEPAKRASKKSFLDDSDSDDDSDSSSNRKHKVRETASSPKPVPTPPPPSSKKKTFLDDSDSESESDDEKRKESRVSAPSHAPPVAPAPPPAKRSIEDSDSESDSSRGKPPPSAPTPPPPPAPAPAPAPQISSSAHSMSSQKKSFLDDSDSEDSDDSQKRNKVAAPAPAPAAAPIAKPSSPDVPVPTENKSFLDDSNSEDDDEDEPPANPTSSAMLADQAKTSVDDSEEPDSDEDSSERSPEPPAIWIPPKIESIIPSLDPEMEAATASAKKSSYFEDSSSESEPESKQQPASGAAARAGQNDSDNSDDSDEEQTERAGTFGHYGYDDGDIGHSSSPIGEAPIAPASQNLLIDSTHDSDGEDDHTNRSEEDSDDDKSHGGGRAAIRNVPDFGAEVTAAIPPSLSGEKEGKAKFVLKGGKLVKQDSGGADAKSGKKVKKKKPKFTIKGGKLVQDDSSVMESSLTGASDHKPAERRSSLDSNSDAIDAEAREDRAKGLAGARRGPATSMVPAARAGKKPGAKSSINFVLKNGKLVKNEEKVKSKQQQPAFSIMGGKLVKAGEAKKKSGRKKSKKVGV